VVRTADSIDTTTRTLLTEVDVPTKTASCCPGPLRSTFQAPDQRPKVTVPVNAMLFRTQGAQVAVVAADGKVQLRRISIGRDYGTTLEVVGGVDVNDRLSSTLPIRLKMGRR